MEWNFTPSQVSLGEVHYTLEDFLRDLQVEIDTNHPEYNEEQRKRLCQLFYDVMYFNFIGRDHKEIAGMLKIDPEFATIIIHNNKANIDMLGAIIMNIFLKNMEETKGLLSDEENVQLVNAELRRFHELHNL